MAGTQVRLQIFDVGTGFTVADVDFFGGEKRQYRADTGSESLSCHIESTIEIITHSP